MMPNRNEIKKKIKKSGGSRVAKRKATIRRIAQAIEALLTETIPSASSKCFLLITSDLISVI